MSESRVKWAISLPILVFELRPMYATDVRQTDRRQTKASLNAPLYQRVHPSRVTGWWLVLLANYAVIGNGSNEMEYNLLRNTDKAI